MRINYWYSGDFYTSFKLIEQLLNLGLGWDVVQWPLLSVALCKLNVLFKL